MGTFPASLSNELNAQEIKGVYSSSPAQSRWYSCCQFSDFLSSMDDLLFVQCVMVIQ